MDYLEICKALFSEFDDHGIEYCHWKSNEHLEAGLRGDTDLDLLIRKSHSKEAQRVLQDSGFKRLETAEFHNNIGTEHYLGYDIVADELVHLHVHYQLMIGNDLKEYYVPWEDMILSNRVRHSKSDVYTTDPTLEMMLLCVRYALKIDRTDYIKRLVGRDTLGDGFWDEYYWLQDRLNLNKLGNYANKHLSAAATELIRSLATEFEFSKLRRLRKHLRSELSLYKTYSMPRKWFEWGKKRIKNKLYWWSRDIRSPNLFRRHFASGGRLIAVVGTDGAGKSTLTKELEEWLSWKVDIQTVYLGSGEHYQTPALLQTNPGKNLLTVPWIILTSFVRRFWLQNAWRARNSGAVIITDRYPQNEIRYNNDGPRLPAPPNYSSFIVQRVIGFENRLNKWAEQLPPDLIIHLDVDPSVAADRVNDTEEHKIREKKQQLDQLSFGGASIVKIDADQPQKEVLREAKRAVWQQF